MEGDAGASRLNPTGGQEQERSDLGEDTGGEERSGSGEDTGGQERSDSGEDTGGQERSDLGEETPPESDAGSQEPPDQPDDQVQDSVEDAPEPVAEDVSPRRQERFGRGWLVTICACLLLLTAGVA